MTILYAFPAFCDISRFFKIGKLRNVEFLMISGWAEKNKKIIHAPSIYWVPIQQKITCLKFTVSTIVKMNNIVLEEDTPALFKFRSQPSFTCLK